MDNPSLLYTLVHARIRTSDLLANSLAYAKRTMICDVLVTPSRPVKTGSRVCIIPLIAVKMDGEDNLFTVHQMWDTGPCEVDGDVLELRVCEKYVVEMLVKNRMGYVAESGIEFAIVSIKLDEQFVSLNWKEKLEQTMLNNLRRRTTTRTLETMTMDEFTSRLMPASIQPRPPSSPHTLSITSTLPSPLSHVSTSPTHPGVRFSIPAPVNIEAPASPARSSARRYPRYPPIPLPRPPPAALPPPVPSTDHTGKVIMPDVMYSNSCSMSGEEAAQRRAKHRAAKLNLRLETPRTFPRSKFSVKDEASSDEEEAIDTLAPFKGKLRAPAFKII